MEVAHHPGLSRTLTAPTIRSNRFDPSSQPPLPALPAGAMSHQSQYSTHSRASERSSSNTQATQDTSVSTLFPPPQPAPQQTGGGPIEAADNVLNKRGDKDQSLFQICLQLRTRLRGLPEVDESLKEEESAADEDMDPVTLLWRTFRRGLPLISIINALNPDKPVDLSKSAGNEKKRLQAAVFKFIHTCVTDLKIPPEDCFILSDLYGDDTTGFVKVTKVVNRVLDILELSGVLKAEYHYIDSSEKGVGAKRTQREHIIAELVNTERTYVQHLELLQAFKKLVEEKGITTGDAVHDIFLNLNALLDFQRRFLIRVEQTNAQPPDEQNWGKLFVLYRDAFKVYEPFIANQKKCEEVAMREFDKLKDTGGTPELRQMVESPTHFTSFLLKPFQRLSKYPLLLRELRDKGDLNDELQADISAGMEAAQSVLQRTNAAIDREERAEAVEELKSRVEDWKGHRLEVFGELLLYGTHTVLKGDNSAKKDQEREYKIFLFEAILLCCKEIDPNKQKNRVVSRGMPDRKGRARLQLKGRIFMQNVTEAISISKPGSYTCQIFWRGDPGIENFVIRFPTDDLLKKWANQVNQQRQACIENARGSGSAKAPATSATEFTYMMNQGQMENPYRQEEDIEEEDEDPVPPYPPFSDYSISRTGSSTSLRSRSTTGESGPPMDSRGPAPPPRFPVNGPLPNQALTLRTQHLQNEQQSHFSPAIDTPQSSRANSVSPNTFPFPRQGTPGSGPEGESNRFTAPAGPRGGAPGNYQQQIQRNGTQRGPSLTPGGSSTQNAMMRMRSASSPDVHNVLRRPSQAPTPPVPDLPPFPTHYAYTPGLVNRSQNNSPSNQQGPPPQRTLTQSPRAQRSQRSQGENNFDYGGPPSRAPTVSSRAVTPASVDSRNVSPPIPVGRVDADLPSLPIPSQLKVKVHCKQAGSMMTLVVSTNISYQSLKDRIDAKLQRSTSLSLSSGQVKLKYVDDDDFVSIQSDEDVQTAFETWKEQQREQLMAGQLGEIELYCQ